MDKITEHQNVRFTGVCVSLLGCKGIWDKSLHLMHISVIKNKMSYI